jgi:hypothetical protein
MRTIETTLYKFSELSESAKQTAIEKYRENGIGDDWWEYVYSDFTTIAEILGIELDTRPVKLMNGTTRRDPAIYFSGFSSQGDGACFSGYFGYSKQCVKRIREHAPQDKELHRIADELAALQKSYFYSLRGYVSQSGRYCHANTMAVDTVEHSAGNYLENSSELENEFQELFRDLANWLYTQLEREYDYLNSDEVIAENIEANDYEFDANGNME